MKLCMFLPPKPDHRWTLASQAGVRFAVVKADPKLTGLGGPWERGVLGQLQQRFADGGFTLLGLEGDPFDMSRIKQGLAGRDEDIERYRQMLGELGRLGLRLLCYNFMVGIGWHRTRADVPWRGGALTSRYDVAEMPSDPLPGVGVLDEAAVWGHYRTFIEAVLPAAEAAGVRMGLHPDDPPTSPLRGIARIFSSPDGFDRALQLSTSPSHGVTFCQANFVAMGADVASLIRRWRDRIAFIHFRDIVGDARNFTETFHDEGPTDMPRMLAAYHAAGLDVPLRPDHAPTMHGESNDDLGYAILGRVFAAGYIRGIAHALDIPME